MKIVKTFTDRYPIIGPLVWVFSIQYYFSQLFAARSFRPSYSISRNTISDLGNTACEIYNHRQVCSPDHLLMNLSFIILGITMAIGSLFIYQEFKESKYSIVGFIFMGLAGLGTAIVGFFPENTIGILHYIGASLPFFVGNIALIIFALTLFIPKAFSLYTLASGSFALLAMVLFLTHTYIGIGVGGIERIAAYPQSIWLIVFGLYISKNHYSRNRPSTN